MMNELQTIGTEAVGQRALFDYAALDQETQVLVRLRASEIKGLAKRVASDIVEIGGKLAEVKDCVGGNGKFNEWLSSELGWSERTAYNFIAVWQKFHAANFALENVATSALYLLAAPSTPPEAIEVARQIADSGQQVTHGVAKEVVRQAKELAPRQEQLIEEPEDEAGEEDGAETPSTAAAAEDAPGAKSAQKPAAVKTPSAMNFDRLAAWHKTRVEITITLMPGGNASTRKVMHSVRAGEGMPFVEMTIGEDDVADNLPIATWRLFNKSYEAFAKKLAEKPPAKPAAKPTKSKPAPKKSAAKSTKKGGKK
jgi:hypothetical protein